MRHKSLLTLLLPGILLCRVVAHSAEHTYEVITTEIASDKEHKIFLQDKNGFLWLGTESGAEVFDSNGQNLSETGYRALQKLEGVTVTALYESGNKVWIGGDRGIYVYDIVSNQLSKFDKRTRYGVTIGSQVSDIMEGSDGKLWIATQGQGLFIYNSADGILQQDSRHGSFYSSLTKGADGLVYAVTMNGIVQSFRPNASLVKEYRLPDYGNVKDLIHIAASGRDIWVASGNRLFHLDIATGNIKTASTPGLRGTINTLLARQDGTLILSTDSGVWEYGAVTGDFSKINQQRYSSAPNDLTISSISEASDGNIILVHAASPLEVMMINPGPIRFVSLPGEHSHALVRTFATSADGNKVWVGSDDGLYLYDLRLKEFVTVNHPELSDIPIKSLARSGDTLWIGTRHDGLYRYNVRSGETKRYVYNEKVPYSLISNQINHVGVTAEGDVLILTDWGVCRYDPVNDNFPQLTEIGQNIRATSMVEETDGTVWIDTENDGYYRRNKGEGRFERIFDRDEKPSRNSAPKFNFDMRRFGAFDSVASSAFDMGNGLTALGAHNGFMIIEPSKLKESENSTFAYPGAISFPFLEDSQEEVEKLGLMPTLLDQKRIEVPYRDNTFTIKFAGVHPLTDPDMKYDYMLRGFDKNWIIGSAIPEVTYTNLPSGEYEFLIRPHGMENAKVHSMRIVVLPPWYRSFWAIIVYFILAILLGYILFIVGRKMVSRKFQKRMKEFEARQERETFEAKTRYFVNLVHEIRTPLMLISMPLEQLADEVEKSHGRDSSEGEKKYIKSMQTNVDYLLGITNQLLDFRKAEKQSEVKLFISRFDIRRLILNLTERFEQPLRLSGKTLACVMPDEEVWITGDKDKLERVLMNLLGNAMKFAQSKINVTLEADNPENVKIMIADDGVGIPETERKRVFDAYYQIQRDKNSENLGTGLGLAYARLITQAHKGEIMACENPEGNGALFILDIPRNSGRAEDKSDSIIAYHSDEEVAGKQDVTVLLVEDNDDLRTMIGDTLAKYYTVITAPDGMVALEMLKERNADVIVSDVMMDRMDGMELCKAVKENVDYSHIPFIILSALTTTDAHEKGLGCGADVYLEKPFPIKQLVLQIENLLRTRRLFHEKMKGVASPMPEQENGTSEPHPGLNRLDAEFLDKMNGIIAEAVADEEFSIDHLAQKVNMSRSSFYRKITALTGMSPNDYLKNFRLNIAAQLLRDGCRVSEVADRVGFTSSSYLAKCFKAKFGMLPSEYRPD